MSLGDYYSHYPVLAAAVVAGKGSVLELGCGYGSTMMLHYMCRSMGVTLVSYDTDGKWLDKFRAGYEGPGHRFVHVQDWAAEGLGFGMQGCVFVDCAPGNIRTPLIIQLAARARFIVAHDSERDHGTGANYEYELAEPHFKYVTEFRRARPYTKIFSNFEPLVIEKCDQEWDRGF